MDVCRTSTYLMGKRVGELLVRHRRSLRACFGRFSGPPPWAISVPQPDIVIIFFLMLTIF